MGNGASGVQFSDSDHSDDEVEESSSSSDEEEEDESEEEMESEVDHRKKDTNEDDDDDEEDDDASSVASIPQTKNTLVKESQSEDDDEDDEEIGDEVRNSMICCSCDRPFETDLDRVATEDNRLPFTCRECFNCTCCYKCLRACYEEYKKVNKSKNTQVTCPSCFKPGFDMRRLFPDRNVCVLIKTMKKMKHSLEKKHAAAHRRIQHQAMRRSTHTATAAVTPDTLPVRSVLDPRLPNYEVFPAQQPVVSHSFIIEFNPHSLHNITGLCGRICIGSCNYFQETCKKQQQQQQQNLQTALTQKAS